MKEAKTEFLINFDGIEEISTGFTVKSQFKQLKGLTKLPENIEPLMLWLDMTVVWVN